LYQFIKRLVDVVAAIVGGLLFVVTYPLIALLVKLSSSGPILFQQPRVGKYGKIFTLYKYRTMSGGATDTWTEDGDPRITALGQILRRFRWDELPQVINLLAGDMSLVGPRPEQPHIAEEMRRQIPFYEERHSVKPGVTGWGQLNVYARSVEETKTKLQYDLYYIKHRSLSFDLEIIAKTLYHVLTDRS
jgi:lipopolysaccharide/colanic/teichoic acid biosynthesis glycosyltransferase